MMVHKSYSFKEADDFDIRFWKRAGAAARLSAAWLMIADYFKIRGGMDVCPDYEDLFKALNACGVRYLVTKDIDVWLPPELNDGQDIYTALRKFGAPLTGLSPKDFANRKLILQLASSPCAH